MQPRHWILVGSLLAGLAVGIGAFGAHGLPKRLEAEQVKAALATKRLESLETGARYHMYHALGILLIGALLVCEVRLPGISRSGWLFLLGIGCFSGWLYMFAFTGSTRWPLITPLGGLCYLLAWTNLAISAWRAAPPATPH